MQSIELKTFIQAYITCALWSSIDDAGEPLDAKYDREDLSPEALAAMTKECGDFMSEHADCWDGVRGYDDAGHGFWLTRNNHGAGFWDGGWSEPAATLLTKASEAFGACSLYVGDDGQVHCLKGE